MRVMVTEQGSHPADRWAVETAAQIVQVNRDGSSTAVMQGKRFEADLLELLERHHVAVQANEKKQLAAHGDRLLAPLDVCVAVQTALADVVSASESYEVIAPVYARADMRDYVRDVLWQQFESAMDVERMIFCDERNLVAEKQRYMEARHTLIVPRPKRAEIQPHSAANLSLKQIH